MSLKRIVALATPTVAGTTTAAVSSTWPSPALCLWSDFVTTGQDSIMKLYR